MKFAECDSNIIQSLPTSCAIKCQQLIMRDYGIDVSESDLCRIAKENGWFDESIGVYMHDNGKLLGCFGIEYHHSQGNDFNDIIKELQQQHRVMVNLNRAKLWDLGVNDKHNEACHAVLVSEIVGNDNDYVSITDPANGNVNQKIAKKTFCEAWKDSQCYMLATETSAKYVYNSCSKSMDLITI